MASLEFYGIRSEQLEWLSNVMSIDGIWCHARLIPWSRPRIDSRGALERLPFDDAVGFDLEIGSMSLSHPIWRDGPQGREIDFVRSQALQFVPSFARAGRVLLEGRLAMSRPTEYEIRGVDPAPLTRWYHQMRRSLSSIMSKDYVLTQTLTDGTVKEWPGVRVSPGAVEWRHGGGLLKQFITGPVEFDIRRK